LADNNARNSGRIRALAIFTPLLPCIVVIIYHLFRPRKKDIFTSQYLPVCALHDGLDVGIGYGPQWA
jgi:cbb3-type cytochrome oxidase subunit 3